MRFILIAASTIALMSVACGDDEKTTPAASATGAATVEASGSPAATVARTTAASTPAGTATKAPAPTAPATGETVEVTGIVGGLNLNENIIEIRRLQGAAVTRISVAGSTVIRKAAGGTVAFKEIRTSDRIIARGTLSERGDVLEASSITVQDVIPGAQPGG